jgi:hypothetical protein
MCIYWRKSHTCGCRSRPYIDRCHAALIAHTNCASNAQDLDVDNFELRKSYFQCFDCLKNEARVEMMALAHAELKLAEAAKKAEEDRREQKKKADELARKERIRKEAEAKAQRERDEDAKKERDRKTEIERQRREGGAWQDVDKSSGRKGKGRKGATGGGGIGPGTPTPVHAPKLLLTREKGTSTSSPKSLKVLTQAPVAATAPVGVDPGGRAGRWGPGNKLVKENERPVGWKK